MASTTENNRAGVEIAHGGRIEQARRQFPGAPEPFIDLSTGINSLSYPVPALPAAAYTRLPEPEALATLQAVAARAYGVRDPTMVVAAPGTQILIETLPRIWKIPRVAVLGPTYAEHAAAWRRGGAKVENVESLASVANARCVVLCNPNNPDGRRLEPATLLKLADRLAAQDGLLVVDEAFADFENSEDWLAPFLPHPAIVILRSFGKTYGLAGLRLGFALAAADRATEIRAALGPWAVSGPALAIGSEALANGGWLENARSRLTMDVTRLDVILRNAGLSVLGGTRLFRLTESPAAAAVFDRLGQSGILVRRFDTHPHWLRFGLPGTGAEWDRLRDALQ